MPIFLFFIIILVIVLALIRASLNRSLLESYDLGDTGENYSEEKRAANTAFMFMNRGTQDNNADIGYIGGPNFKHCDTDSDSSECGNSDCGENCSRE